MIIAGKLISSPWQFTSWCGKTTSIIASIHDPLTALVHQTTTLCRSKSLDRSGGWFLAQNHETTCTWNRVEGEEGAQPQTWLNLRSNVKFMSHQVPDRTKEPICQVNRLRVCVSRSGYDEFVFQNYHIRFNNITHNWNASVVVASPILDISPRQSPIVMMMIMLCNQQPHSGCWLF